MTQSVWLNWPSNGANRVLSMRAHPSPDLQFNVILSFSNETSVFFAASNTFKSIILSPTTPKVMKALEGFLQSAISKLPIMTLTSACDDGGNDAAMMALMQGSSSTSPTAHFEKASALLTLA